MVWKSAVNNFLWKLIIYGITKTFNHHLILAPCFQILYKVSVAKLSADKSLLNGAFEILLQTLENPYPWVQHNGINYLESRLVNEKQYFKTLFRFFRMSILGSAMWNRTLYFFKIANIRVINFTYRLGITKEK